MSDEPLDIIINMPSVEAIQRRIEAIAKEAKILKSILKLAERIAEDEG